MAFSSCDNLKSVSLPNTITSIGDYAFCECFGLASIVIPNGVTTIGASAFSPCTSLTAINIPSSVTSIGNNAFWGCENLSKIICARSNPPTADVYTFPQGVTAIVPCNGEVFRNATGWKNLQIKEAFSIVGTTQTTISVEAVSEVSDFYVSTTINRYDATGNKVVITGLSPNRTYYLYAYGTCEGIEMQGTLTPQTKAVSLNITAKPTASSCTLTGVWNSGDATVISYGFDNNPDTKTLQITGLDPKTSNGQTFYVVTKEGGKHSVYATFTTAALSLKTSQPKVVSQGNAIVAADSNLDDEETNVGFEWRRTDWSDDFASNTGGAYIYNGTMEGYIRNLNTEKLWKYRPYYLSDSGKYHYGDWVGLDPTNTSYFEPTVHTYASINIEGNTALVKGYALTGTDKIKVQGFKYWRSVATAGASGFGKSLVASIPGDAKTVEASGQVMTANITGLDYNATYHYVAFATTSEGETYYGEEQVFTTGEDPAGIGGIDLDTINPEPATVVARYNLNGQLLTAPQKGINILRMSDGTVQKVYVK